MDRQDNYDYNKIDRGLSKRVLLLVYHVCIADVVLI